MCVTPTYSVSRRRRPRGLSGLADDCRLNDVGAERSGPDGEGIEAGRVGAGSVEPWGRGRRKYESEGTVKFPGQ